MTDVFGTNGSDSWGTELIGTSGDDRLFGFGDHDWLIPTLGNDLLDGGADSDVAIYSYFDLFTSGVTINNTDTAIGSVLAYTVDKRGFGTDTLVDVENFHGTQYDDAIYLGPSDTGTYTFDEGGDDIVWAYQGSTNVGNLFFAGAGNDTYYGSSAADDGLDYRNAPAGVTVLFTGVGSGTATDGWGRTDTFTGIEWVSGSAYGDTIVTGSGNRDDLTGRAGNDTLNGGAGDRDRVRYDREDGGNGVTVDLGAGTATDSHGDTDTLIGIEDVNGTEQDDVLTGSDVRNHLRGNGGDDELNAVFNTDAAVPWHTGDDLAGGAGNDTLNGSAREDYLQPGAGDDVVTGGDNPDNTAGDWLSYLYDEGATQGIRVTFTGTGSGTAQDWSGGTDTFTGIEAVQGTDFDDHIETDGENSHLYGYGGNDRLVGHGGNDQLEGGEGDDVLDGGAGDGDRARYHHEIGGAGIIVDLAEGTAADTYGDTDTLIGIEDVRGTEHGDQIAGDDNDNALIGDGGDDTLIGRVGQDYLEGGAGDDTLDGGDGGDHFRPGAGEDIITGGDVLGPIGQRDFLDYSDDETTTSGISVYFSTAADGTVDDRSDSTDTFTGIESVEGTNFADRFYGAEGDNTFRGLGGDDYFDGGAGNNDEVEYREDKASDGAFQGINANLVTGIVIDTFGDTDTLVSIENIEGSRWDDTIIGNTADNRLDGGSGDDYIDSGLGGRNGLSGGEGSDTLILRTEGWVSTGAGNDTVTVYADYSWVEMGLGNNTLIAADGSTELAISYAPLDGAVVVDLEAGTTTKADGGSDTFSNVNEVQGGRGDDTLLGSNGSGFERFRASFGDDTIDGRGGEDDRLSYRHIDADVTFDIDEGTASADGFGTTTFSNIEQFEGWTGDDTFLGGAGDDEFRGLGGTDTYHGGDGIDRISFTGDWHNGGTGGVEVDLAAGTATDGFGNAETFTSIERVFGSFVGDTLLGDDSENGIWGDSGDDSIDTRAGDDSLSGGFGADVLTGGSGQDTFYGWLGHLDGDTIYDLEAGDRIAVYADGWGSLLGADIWADASNIHIDISGDGVADASMVNQSGYSGQVQSLGGPVGGPVPAVVTLSGAGGLLSSAPESDGPRTVTAVLTRSGDIFAQVTVDYVLAGYGSNPVDTDDIVGGLGSGSLTFAPGQTSASIDVVIQGDTDIEPDEMLSLALTGITSDGAVPGELADTTAFLRILNDDTLPQVHIAGGKTSEDSGPLTFTITRDGPDLSQSLDVMVQFTGGTGARQAQSDDVVGGLPQSLTVTLAPGEAVATIELETVADTVSEFHEAVVAQITGLGGTAAPGYEIGSGIGVGEIRNDDGIPPLPPGLDATSAMDPHLITFDGLNYDFQAVGEFILVEAVSGDPLSIQVRYSAVKGSDLASFTSAVATDLGGATLMVDVGGATLAQIDGVAFDLADAAGGTAVGDSMLYYDGEVLTVVYANGDQLRVDIFEGFLNTNVYLTDGREVRGLLGDGDGETGNDLALRDGAVLTQPIGFDTLYGEYADSWRVSDTESLFHYAPGQGTADFTDSTHPVAAITLDDLPPELLAAATRAADGNSDPDLKTAAILDFVLSGNADYFEGATRIDVEITDRAEPVDAPAIPTAFGVLASDLSVTEGNSGATPVLFTVYRTGDTSGSAEVSYTLGGDVDASDVSGLITGHLSFAAGESAKSVAIDILGDSDVETDETLSFDFGFTDTSETTGMLLSSTAHITILNDDFAPVEPEYNLVTGTDGRDRLIGTDGDDVLMSLGGTFDRATGGLGADVFVFGAETGNGTRERDVIYDFDGETDAIALIEGAAIDNIRETSSGLVIRFEGDRDLAYLRGDGLDANTLTILEDFTLAMG